MATIQMLGANELISDSFQKINNNFSELNTAIENKTFDIDDALSLTSTNPVQNKVVKTNMDSLYNNLMTKLNVYRSELPTKVSDLENDAGYLTQHQSLDGYAKTSVANIWTGQQTFNKAILKDTVLVKAHIRQEVYQSEYINGTTITPTRSTMCLVTTGATTLDMTTIVADFLSVNKASTVFTAYITSNADYTLTITNAGTIKYIGSASDVAITSAGLLLNIMMLKDASGNVTSIVQASKLS